MLTISLTEIINHLKDVKDADAMQYHLHQLTELKNIEDQGLRKNVSRYTGDSDKYSLSERLDLTSVTDTAMRLVSKCTQRNISSDDGDPYYKIVLEILDPQRYFPKYDLGERTRSELLSSPNEYEDALAVILKAHTKELKTLRKLKKSHLVDELTLNAAYIYKVTMDVIRDERFDYSNTLYPLSYVVENLYNTESFSAYLYQKHALSFHTAIYNLMVDTDTPIATSEHLVTVMRLIAHNWDTLTDSQKITYASKVVEYAYTEVAADHLERTLYFFTPPTASGKLLFNNLHNLYDLGVDLQKPGLIDTLIISDAPAHSLPDFNV